MHEYRLISLEVIRYVQNEVHWVICQIEILNVLNLNINIYYFIEFIISISGTEWDHSGWGSIKIF